jgi:hypothetical protein
MKVTPLVQGTGVPSASNVSQTSTPPSKIQRAKAVMQGQEVPRETQSSGDPQVDKAQASLRKIKMKTQMSTNRHEVQDPVQTVVEALAGPAQAEIPTPDTVEQALPVETGTVEETKQISPQFAALAKMKRSLQVKERELAQREEALKTQAPNGEEFLSKAELKANPLKIFETGVTYDQLTEAILNNQNQIDPAKLRQEIKDELKKEFASEFSTRDQQAEQQVLGELRRDALALTAQGEQYEAIRQARAQDDVVELIHRTWKSTGEVMDVQTAAELVENQLIDEALPFAKIKKLQSRLNPQETTAQTPVPQGNQRPMKTLTNRDGSASTLLNADRRTRALAAWTGQLKRG